MVQPELSRVNAGRQVAQVADLLARDPDGAQSVLVGSDQLGGRRRSIPEKGGETTVDRARRFRGELLAHDGAHQGAVGLVGASAAASRVIERTDVADEGRHYRVVALQQKAKARVPIRVRGLVGSGLAAHPTGRRRAWRPGSSYPGSTSARR
jgi:hypothetical protein